MPNTSTANHGFFRSSYFQIAQPLVQWNENYRITNDQGQSLFACRPRSFLRGLLAAILAIVFIIALIIATLILFAKRIEGPGGLFVALVPPFLLGLIFFVWARGRHNIKIFNDPSRKELIYTIHQDKIFPNLAPTFTLISAADEKLGIIKRRAFTLIGEGWKILDANGATVALVQQNIANTMLGGLAVLKEGSNQTSRFTIADATSKEQICELKKGVFNLADSYRLDDIVNPKVAPILLIALVLVLDTTYFATKDAPSNAEVQSP